MCRKSYLINYNYLLLLLYIHYCEFLNLHMFCIYYTLTLLNATDQDEWLQLLTWQGNVIISKTVIQSLFLFSKFISVLKSTISYRIQALSLKWSTKCSSICYEIQKRFLNQFMVLKKSRKERSDSYHFIRGRVQTT